MTQEEIRKMNIYFDIVDQNCSVRLYFNLVFKFDIMKFIEGQKFFDRIEDVAREKKMQQDYRFWQSAHHSRFNPN